MTNLTTEDVPAAAAASGAIKLAVNGKEVRKLVQTFGDGNSRRTHRRDSVRPAIWRLP